MPRFAICTPNFGTYADPRIVTSRIRIGTAVAVLPRRPPHIMASTAVTLDHLSGGRLVLGVGIGGGHDEYSAVGDEPDAARRAAKLDEALLVIDRLWPGERVDHEGDHYRVSGVTLGPLPVQRPRIPIWVGGNGAPSLRRTARWDGWLADSAGSDGMRLAPEEVAARVETIAAARGGLDGFDVAAMGYTSPGSEEGADRIQVSERPA
jgi:alkanesulfonate monooxygenase SsuD/methylene tetrahydromethanopterin reductase-like flavin-dependent oxidoreductase (luciferase family)